MSQPLCMSFRPDALDMCLDGRKTQTRRIWKPEWKDISSFDGDCVVEIVKRIPSEIEKCGKRVLHFNAIWSVGESIGLKRKRTGCIEGRVLCTGLRIEHVQNISEEDAKAEGVEQQVCIPDYGGHRMVSLSARESYRGVWMRLYPRGPNSWSKNPMVLVIEFKPIGVKQ